MARKDELSKLAKQVGKIIRPSAQVEESNDVEQRRVLAEIDRRGSDSGA